MEEDIKNILKNIDFKNNKLIKVNNNLYLVFSKDNKYLNYEEYIK